MSFIFISATLSTCGIFYDPQCIVLLLSCEIGILAATAGSAGPLRDDREIDGAKAMLLTKFYYRKGDFAMAQPLFVQALTITEEVGR